MDKLAEAASTGGKKMLKLLCGIGLLANPLFAKGVPTIMLAVYFVIDGIFGITVGSAVLRVRSGAQ